MQWIAAEPVTTTRLPHGFLFALLLSLALHAVLMNTLPYPVPQSAHVKDAGVDISFLMKRPPHPAAEAPKPQAPELRPVNVSARAKPIPGQKQASRESPQRPLKLDSATISRVIAGLIAESPDTDSLSDNGAVVLDSQLLARLNSAERQVALLEEPAALTAGSDFSGGSWSEYVVIDGACFRVSTANPLDPVPRDTWHRVQCK